MVTSPCLEKRLIIKTGANVRCFKKPKKKSGGAVISAILYQATVNLAKNVNQVVLI